jgi:magnesium transporter
VEVGLLLRYSPQSSKKAGLAPGTLIHVGKRYSEKTTIGILDYNSGYFEEKIPDNVEDVFPYRDSSNVTWINITGLADVGIIEKIGTHFNLHPLILEDILNTGQRPKTEDYGDYVFVVLKMLYFGEETTKITAEQVSIVLGENYVLSFQETRADIFDPLRERLRNPNSRIRKMDAGYLAYGLMDAIVDNYFLMLENVGEYIDDLERDLIENPDRETLEDINYIKGEMIFLRKYVWPLREVISNLERIDSPFIRDQTSVFLRDLYDHTVQIIDTVETYKEMLSGMLELYLSNVSNRMNEVMKILTIIATIFIPLTFIAGIYGMNFEYMPELHWKRGYPAVLLLMVLIFLSMIYYFKRKKWL